MRKPGLTNLTKLSKNSFLSSVRSRITPHNVIFFVFIVIVLYLFINEIALYPMQHTMNSNDIPSTIYRTKTKTIIETYPGGSTYNVYSDGTVEEIYTNPEEE